MSAVLGLPVKTRVLLLGSDSTLERGMVAALRSESCEVNLAADCRQALNITRTGQVDVLVLDFDVHCREEFSQLALEFSLAERGCQTLVLANSLEQLTLASETRVDGVLMKPLDPDYLRTVIHNLLVGVPTQALAERWRPNTALVLEALPSRRGRRINELKESEYCHEN
jgi:DNA-binding response OmpR family regulator